MERVIELLNDAGEAACAVDRGQRVTFWNPAAQTLLGFEAWEVLSKPCYEIFRGTDDSGRSICRRGCAVLRCALNSRSIPAQDVRAYAKDGRTLWVSVSTLRIPSRWQELSLLIHLFRDITRAKSIEGHLKQLFDKLNRSLEASDPISDERSQHARPHGNLTTRELDVLKQLASGLSTATVATTLSISDATVRNHIHHILCKLGVHNRLEAVTLALRNRLL